MNEKRKTKKENGSDKAKKKLINLRHNYNSFAKIYESSKLLKNYLNFLLSLGVWEFQKLTNPKLGDQRLIWPVLPPDALKKVDKQRTKLQYELPHVVLISPG